MDEQAALKDLEQDEELQSELDRIFDHHPPPAHVAKIHGAWRTLFKSIAGDLMGLPPTRERAMALTRLEECSFWVQSSIARNHKMFDEPEEETDVEGS